MCAVATLFKRYINKVTKESRDQYLMKHYSMSTATGGEQVISRESDEQ